MRQGQATCPTNASTRPLLFAAIFLVLLLPCALSAKDPDRTYNKSWVWVDGSNGGKQLVSGDTWDVPVDYYLDPSDHDGKTTLAMWGAGPWIDTPDGKYVKERGHISYPGLFQTFDISPGHGQHVFSIYRPSGTGPGA